MASLKGILIANLYLIGSVVIAAGFVWMFILAFIPQGFEMVIIAFSVAVGGIGFWAIAYYMGGKEENKERVAAPQESGDQSKADRRHEESTVNPAA